MAKKIAAAILLCAVMVMLAAAPLAMADTHHIVKGPQGPRASARTWEYVPIDYGTWHGRIVNNGLRWLVVDVYDNTTGVPISKGHERIRFAAYNAFPTGVVNTSGVVVNPTHKYEITVTPNGPQTSYCDVEDMFQKIVPPVAVISVTSVNGLTVTVDGSLSYDPDGTIMGYAWSFGDGGIATGMTATHTYTLGGTYNIALVVTDNDGLTGSDVQPVTVTKELVPPVASFTATMSFMTVSVDASASYDPDGTTLTYAWDFGDMATGVGKTATHTYLTEGMYTIILTVTDVDMLTDSTSTQITAIMPVPPVAMFTVTPTDLTVAVDASGSYDPDGTIATYAWIWGDATAAGSGKTATHTYAAGGTYLITLTVTDMQGLTGSADQPVTVRPGLIPPVARFTSTVSFLVVDVDASASTDADGTIGVYSWNWGDGTAAGSGKVTSHTYAAGGTYTITLTVTDNDLLTNSASKPVTVRPAIPPVARFTSTVSFLVVNVDASTSSDADGTIGAYSWNWGDATVAGSGVTATHTYAAGGDYTITLTVTDNDLLTNSVSHVVSVRPAIPPVASFTATPTFLVVSVDASASSDADGTIGVYAWNWGDGTAAGSGMITSHTYAAGGTYTITLTVTDNDLLTNSASKTVTVAPEPPDNAPVAFFTWTASGLTVNVNAAGSTDDHGIVSYVWNWGDGTPDTSGLITSHTYTQAVGSPGPAVSSPIVAQDQLPPYLLYGYTTDALGNPIECTITVTNLRTGASNTTNSFQVDPWPLDGYYELDIQHALAGAFLPGDQIKVDCVSRTGGMTGTNTVPVPTPQGGSLEIDVTVTGGVVHFDRTITLTVADVKGQTSTYSVTVTLPVP